MDGLDKSNKHESLLIIDDDITIGTLLHDLLSNIGFDCCYESTAQGALDRMQEKPFPLALCDVHLLDMRGEEVVSRLLEINPEIIVIMVSGDHDINVALECIRRGAIDYITKPFTVEQLNQTVIRALNQLATRRKKKKEEKILIKKLNQNNNTLKKTVNQLGLVKLHLQKAEEEIIFRLALAAEYRDEDTWGHLLRISEGVYQVAQVLELPQPKCDVLRHSSLLHDVGKIGIPDHILLKTGKLTREEFEIMKSHTEIGYRILAGSQYPLIRSAAKIALSHHERYNGSGYPYGKKGDEIPLSAQIVSIVDVFDALISERPYKEAWEKEPALEEIVRGKGTLFNPKIIDAFMEVCDDLYYYKEQFNQKDHDSDVSFQWMFEKQQRDEDDKAMCLV